MDLDLSQSSLTSVSSSLSRRSWDPEDDNPDAPSSKLSRKRNRQRRISRSNSTSLSQILSTSVVSIKSENEAEPGQITSAVQRGVPKSELKSRKKTCQSVSQMRQGKIKRPYRSMAAILASRSQKNPPSLSQPNPTKTPESQHRASTPVFRIVPGPRGPAVSKRKTVSQVEKKRLTQPQRAHSRFQAMRKQIRPNRFNEQTLQIPKMPFGRLVREQIEKLGEPKRIQVGALAALQLACEEELTRVFEAVNLLSLHAKRKTGMPRDLKMALRLKKVLCTHE